MVMMKDRVCVAGVSEDMWKEEQNAALREFLTDSSQKLLIVRVANDQLVSNRAT